MKYLVLLRNPKSLVLLVDPLFRPRWIDAIDRGLMRNDSRRRSEIL